MNARNDYDTEFSSQIDHNGRTYYSTGKTGSRIKDGIRVGEMESGDYSRIWIDAANNVYPE